MTHKKRWRNVITVMALTALMVGTLPSPAHAARVPGWDFGDDVEVGAYNDLDSGDNFQSESANENNYLWGETFMNPEGTESVWDAQLESLISNEPAKVVIYVNPSTATIQQLRDGDDTIMQAFYDFAYYVGNWRVGISNATYDGADDANDLELTSSQSDWINLSESKWTPLCMQRDCVFALMSEFNGSWTVYDLAGSEPTWWWWNGYANAQWAMEEAFNDLEASWGCPSSCSANLDGVLYGYAPAAGPGGAWCTDTPTGNCNPDRFWYGNPDRRAGEGHTTESGDDHYASHDEPPSGWKARVDVLVPTIFQDSRDPDDWGTNNDYCGTPSGALCGATAYPGSGGVLALAQALGDYIPNTGTGKTQYPVIVGQMGIQATFTDYPNSRNQWATGILASHNGTTYDNVQALIWFDSEGGSPGGANDYAWNDETGEDHIADQDGVNDGWSRHTNSPDHSP